MKLLCAGIIIWAITAQAGISPRTYYVDCAHGSDAADGLTSKSAWQSTARVSRSTFQPGDAILFRRGTTCTGMLWPKGSGVDGAAIRVGDWGAGPRPRVQAGPDDEAALKLWNQSFWTIENLHFSGGNPHGVWISGDRGVVRRIHVRDVEVSDVGGGIRNKEGGLLVVAPGSAGQRFDDVLIDGVVAHHTTQWAGILVGGVAFGFLPESARSTNVTVRNSIVHDVEGDGIVLFQVNHGVIEDSAAWRTGLQKTLTIGTPNAIWTWMCRGCSVRRNEAFLTASPDIDGGAFDVDYGSDNTLVEANYGHDTQGYCVAVFGAGWVTTNTIVRGNVCEANGLRANLALRQGAIFLSSWNDGALKDVEISGNVIHWAPPVDAPMLVNNAAFVGSGQFHHNQVTVASKAVLESNAGVLLDANSYFSTSGTGTRWRYAGKDYAGFAAYREGTGQDANSRLAEEAAGLRDNGAAVVKRPLPPNVRQRLDLVLPHQRPVLLAFPSSAAFDGAARALAVLLKSSRAHFRDIPLDAAIGITDVHPPAGHNSGWADTGLPVLPALQPDDFGCSGRPCLVLIDEKSEVVRRWDRMPLPGELGPALRVALRRPAAAP